MPVAIKTPVILADPYENFRQRIILKAIGNYVALSGSQIEKVTLYYTSLENNNDKQYDVSITQDSLNSNLYHVEFAYGKRGGVLKPGRKTISGPVSFAEAKEIFNTLVTQKKSNGYTTDVSGVPFS